MPYLSKYVSSRECVSHCPDPMKLFETLTSGIAYMCNEQNEGLFHHWSLIFGMNYLSSCASDYRSNPIGWQLIFDLFSLQRYDRMCGCFFEWRSTRFYLYLSIWSLISRSECDQTCNTQAVMFKWFMEGMHRMSEHGGLSSLVYKDTRIHISLFLLAAAGLGGHGGGGLLNMFSGLGGMRADDGDEVSEWDWEKINYEHKNSLTLFQYHMVLFISLLTLIS